MDITCLGYRVLVQPIELDLTQDSAHVFIPEDLRQKFGCYEVVQLGVGFGHAVYDNMNRPPMEIKKGDKVLIDTSKGSQGVKEMSIGKYEFKLVSYWDVLAILEEADSKP